MPLAADLPDEIWRDIFFALDGLEAQTDSRADREKAVGRLSSVCRSWRAICITTSALWRHVTFDDRNSCVHAELLRISVSLARSHYQRLDVSIAISSPDPSVLSLVILSLEEHFERIRTLNLGLVYMDAPHSPRLDISWWRTLHYLEDLTLENTHFNSSPELHTLLRFTPALRSLRVGGLTWITHIPPEGDRVPLALPLLQDFTLDSYALYTFIDVPFGVPALERLTILNTEYSLSWSEILSRLTWKSSPSELTLSGAYPEWSVAMLLARFPTIEHLVLYSCPTDVVKLLRSLPAETISALRHLTIDRCQFSNLQALSFLDDPITGETLAPNIKLHLRNCPYVSPEVGAKLEQRGRATFEDATITQAHLLGWVANDYTRFGLRFYPSRRRHRKAALTGHY